MSYLILLAAVLSRPGVAAPTQLSSGPAPATYYLSQSAGADSNDGRSERSAWKSLDRIYALALSRGLRPGDRILLRRGDSWRGQITLGCRPSGGGTALAPIELASYGEGAPPMISGDSEGWDWQPEAEHPGVFKAQLGAGDLVMQGYSIYRPMKGQGFFPRKLDGASQLSAALRGLTPGTFLYTGKSAQASMVFAKTATAHRPVYPETILFREAGVSIDGCNYLKVRDLALQKFQFGFDIGDSSHVELKNNHIEDTLSMGIYLKGGDKHVLLEGNEIERAGNDAIYVLKSAHNIVRGNRISHITKETLGCATGGDKAAIGLQESEDDLVENNQIEYSKAAIDYYYENGSTVRSNFAFHVSGLGSPHGTNLDVYDNIVNIDPPNNGTGVAVQNTGTGHLIFRNNTVYGVSSYGLIDGSQAGKGPVEFKNNIIFSESGGLPLTRFSDRTQSDYNCYFARHSGNYELNKNVFSSLADFQAAAGKETHSVYADPGFGASKPGNHPEDFKLKDSSLCKGFGAKAGHVGMPKP